MVRIRSRQVHKKKEPAIWRDYLFEDGEQAKLDPRKKTNDPGGAAADLFSCRTLSMWITSEASNPEYNNKAIQVTDSGGAAADLFSCRTLSLRITK